jgi:hypothetical protein
MCVKKRKWAQYRAHNLCVGRFSMIAILLLLTLAINGGLYVGTILHTAVETARFDQVLDLYQKLWS